MKNLNDKWLVQVFMLVHGLVALCSRLFGFSDELILTIITMLMALLLCQRHNVSTSQMTLILILVNVVGFFLPKPISLFIRDFIIDTTYFSAPITTMLVTEIIGMGILLLLKLFKKRKSSESGSIELDSTFQILAFIAIIVVRLIMALKNYSSSFRTNLEVNIVLDYVFTCVVIFYLAQHTLRVTSQANKEMVKAHAAEYSYIKLKQQVEPHFIFNSLNILDCLVYSDKKEAASTFIHKLSHLYRYMIDNEDESVVPLSDEMAFVDEYISLLQVRFETSFIVNIDIPAETYSHSIVPCSVQMQIENAVKHNRMSEDNPLVIDIYEEKGYIIVKNNVFSKNTSLPSTGKGLKYIRQRYMDVVEKEVIVSSENDVFIVKLPLI